MEINKYFSVGGEGGEITQTEFCGKYLKLYARNRSPYGPFNFLYLDFFDYLKKM